MSERDDLLLGRATDYDLPYSPAILQALPRAPARAACGLADAKLPFHGCDIWNAWELSWLAPGGKPVVAWGELRVPASSAALVESKSLKLYLNSLNQQEFDSPAAVAALIEADLTACLGAPVAVAVRLPAAWPQQLALPAGSCLDELPLTTDVYEPAPERLVATGPVTTERLFSRLLRSRCPVTGQPDWGTLLIDYTGPAIDHVALLAYVISYRLHQDFHEACVERIFMDLLQRCAPERLTVSARYLRRGGLDINPWRSSDPQARPHNERLFQQ